MVTMVKEEVSSPTLVSEIVSIIDCGGVVVLPTDTQYALCVDALNEQAVMKIFELKSRSQLKPIPILVADTTWAHKYASVVTGEAVQLMQRFWPGALTLIFHPMGWLPPILSGAGEGIGLRVPDRVLLLDILRLLARPLTGTSANLTGCPPATSGDQIKRYFGDRIDFVVNSTIFPSSLPSTVVDVRCSPPVILRPGACMDEIQSVLDNMHHGYYKTETGFGEKILPRKRQDSDN